MALVTKSFDIEFPMNQFNEKSLKPPQVFGKFALFLYHHTVFYSERSSEPLVMKASYIPRTDTTEEKGPISPSTKI